MSVKLKQDIERFCVRKTVECILNAGDAIEVYDREDITLKFSTDVDHIMNALFSTGGDVIFAIDKESGKRKGFMSFVYGNDKTDIYLSRSLEAIIAPATSELAELIDRVEYEIEIKPFSTPNLTRKELP
jgi:hypothetical protein